MILVVMRAVNMNFTLCLQMIDMVHTIMIFVQQPTVL